MSIDILEHADHELLESVAAYGEDPDCAGGFPHVRISEERAQVYRERLEALIEDLLHEPVDPHGRVYGIVFEMFLAPPYLQDTDTPPGSSPRKDADAAERE